jgi:hypothetical protein
MSEPMRGLAPSTRSKLSREQAMRARDVSRDEGLQQADASAVEDQAEGGDGRSGRSADSS